MLEQGDSTWVWATGVRSQNPEEYSSLTCAQITNVPSGHKCSLVHFPQWAGSIDITIFYVGHGMKKAGNHCLQRTREMLFLPLCYIIHS